MPLAVNEMDDERVDGGIFGKVEVGPASQPAGLALCTNSSLSLPVLTPFFTAPFSHALCFCASGEL